MNDETIVMNKIVLHLNKKGYMTLRQNSGVFYDKNGNRVRIGFPGMSDLIAIDGNGIVSFLEVKTSHSAHKRKEQIKFINAMKSKGYRAGFVTNEEEAERVANGTDK